MATKPKTKPTKHVKRPQRSEGVSGGGGGGFGGRPKLSKDAIKAMYERRSPDFPTDPDERIAFNTGDVEIQSAKQVVPRRYVASGVKVETPQEALEAYEGGSVKKSELPHIAFTFGMIDDPDNCTPNNALGLIREAVKNNFDPREFELLEIEKHNQKLASKSEVPPSKPIRKIKKMAQYTQDAYMGNGGEKPGLNDSQLEESTPPRYEEKKVKYLVKPQQRDPVQPKAAVGDLTEDNVDPSNEGLKGVVASINTTLEGLDLESLQEIRSVVAKTFNKEEWPQKEASWS